MQTRTLLAIDLLVLGILVLAGCAQVPIALRDMGSFHVGGRDVEISGRPVKEIVFTPGGVPAKVDPNGTYAVEAMYVQYFLPAERRGVVPLLPARTRPTRQSSASAQARPDKVEVVDLPSVGIRGNSHLLM